MSTLPTREEIAEWRREIADAPTYRGHARLLAAAERAIELEEQIKSVKWDAGMALVENANLRAALARQQAVIDAARMTIESRNRVCGDRTNDHWDNFYAALNALCAALDALDKEEK